jgi:hypothetical protein
VDPLLLNSIIAGVSIVGTFLAVRIKSGAKPAIDPNNTRPVIDAGRDAARSLIVKVFGGGEASPTSPPVPTSAPSDLQHLGTDLLVAAMKHFGANPPDAKTALMLAPMLDSLKQLVQPAPAA